MNHRARLAPTPSGYLHLGHAATFLQVQKNIRAKNGTLILRIEDIDKQRCQLKYLEACVEDLHAIGLSHLYIHASRSSVNDS